MLCEAQGHVIEAHGTRTVYMRLGPEGQGVGAEFRVTNMKSPILQHGEVGQTRLQVRDRLCARCREGIAAWRWKL